MLRRLIPTSFKSPFCIDGDPHNVSEVHVNVLPKALKLFYLPAADESGSGANGLDTADMLDEQLMDRCVRIRCATLFVVRLDPR